MSIVKTRVKKLVSMKNDIEKRFLSTELDINNKNLISRLQSKLNSFFIEINIAEKDFFNKKPTDSEAKSFDKEIEELKIFAENLQAKISGDKNEKTENNENLLLYNLSFLKNIANQMLLELEQQNYNLEKKIKSVENNQFSLINTQKKLSKFDGCIDKLSNTCLITTMITLALIIVLIMAIL